MIAKQREYYREGRPKKYSRKQIQHALELTGTHSYKEVENKTGVSKITLFVPNGRNRTNNETHSNKEK